VVPGTTALTLANYNEQSLQPEKRQKLNANVWLDLLHIMDQSPLAGGLIWDECP
jgi:hypothetical protein